MASPVTAKPATALHGEPALKIVLADNADITHPAINLQVSRLIQRCGVAAGMAETLAPMVFGLLS